MNESYSVETIDRTNLTDQTKFKLNEISKIQNYFKQKIKERKSNNYKWSKYVVTFDYIDKILILIVFFPRSGGISIIGAPVGIASARFTLFFFSNYRNDPKITEYNKK